MLVVANLKAKNLVKFKSHGMVLCAAGTNKDEDGTETVEFIEPPEGAKLGEVASHGVLRNKWKRKRYLRRVWMV